MHAELLFLAPWNFSIDTLHEIADGRAKEADDDLWLFQTDLEHFCDRARYHEQRVFTKPSRIQGCIPLTTKEKWDEVAYIMTTQAMDQAREWQYLLEECRVVKSASEESQVDIGEGRPLPVLYEKALGSLQKLLHHSRHAQRLQLQRLSASSAFRDGQSFHQYKLSELPDLYKTDHTSWCLHQLITSPD